MSSYKTPGVYVEEIPTLPPSVAEVSTAIPAFIGYTAKRHAESGPQVARINTLLEYENLFGKAKPTGFTVKASDDAGTGLKKVDSVSFTDAAAGQPEFLMHYCVSHFYKNGGGSCYIVSVGDYGAPPAKAGFEAGLTALEKEDEPTLILLTDAVKLLAADYHEVCQKALAQCNKLRDRFVILDVQGGDVKAFRDNIGTSDLMYGAAYHPYLKTSLNYQYQEDAVQIEGAGEGAGPAWARSFGNDGVSVRHTGDGGETPEVRIIAGDSAAAVEFSVDRVSLTIRNVADRTGAEVASAWSAWSTGNDRLGFDVVAVGDGTGSVPHTSNRMEELNAQVATAASGRLASIRSKETALYNQIKTALTTQRVVLPPSAAVAGIYARVDRERGVWKAPANVSVSAVTGPVAKTTDEAQADLNVDATAGKSINVIRSFAGKGTLVWGARTLAGNDNEWRYVPVRRLFITIEESIQKSTAFAVFEPNTSATWLKVKGMIQSYLYGLWEKGALAGPTPESAYFVNVGLGRTMTAQDILEGRMIVEVGVAAVRPAEFIILRFSHKMQEA